MASARLEAFEASAVRRSPLDQCLEAIEGAIERGLRGTEREAHVRSKPGRAPCASLAWVHVEELARHADDLLFESRAEEAHAVGDRRRKAAHVAPEIEGAVGNA